MSVATNNNNTTEYQLEVLKSQESLVYGWDMRHRLDKQPEYSLPVVLHTSAEHTALHTSPKRPRSSVEQTIGQELFFGFTTFSKKN